MGASLHNADSLELLPTLPDNSIDAVVTDPPAGIGFMGKEWDDFRRKRNRSDSGRENVVGRTSASGPECGRRYRGAFIEFIESVMRECLRVSKPGAYALIWAIPRTSHWTAMGIENAGWTISDRVCHIFGQGFPKHKSKLKPACEDWWLAWKPDRKATPLNIDDCRIATAESLNGGAYSIAGRSSILPGDHRDGASLGMLAPGAKPKNEFSQPSGRWPANVAFDEFASGMLDAQTGILQSGKAHVLRRGGTTGKGMGYGSSAAGDDEGVLYGDQGGASRFFYCSKASKSDRGEGNDHPTVKHTDLMQWLIRLISKESDSILDPFMGSGTTGVAAAQCGRNFVGIERDPHYFEIAKSRIDAEMAAPELLAVKC